MSVPFDRFHTPRAYASQASGFGPADYDQYRMEGSHMLTMSTRQKEKQFRIIFAATYLLFLAAAIVQRMLPHAPSQFEAQSRSSRSIFHEAKALADRTIPFAFMG
jgi:hypothetical protein